MLQPDINVPAEDFTKLITDLKKAHQGSTNLTRNDMKHLTGQVFGNMRDSVENIIDLIYGSRDELTNESPGPSRSPSVSSLSYVSKEEALDQLQEPTEEISHAACDIEEDNGQATCVSTTTPTTPTAASSPGRRGIHRALEVLDGMASQLRSFYQWLKEKAQKMASDLWQSVRRAFSTMLAWVRSICRDVRASAKVHVA